MHKTMIGLAVGACLAVFGPQAVQARGFGGYHGGSSGGGYHEGSSSGSRYHEGSGSTGGYHEGGESGRGYSSGGQRESGHSGAEGAAAGHAATSRNEPQHSGAEGAAAGATAANRNDPQHSGAQGAAAGAAASNRNNPQYSGAEGAAAGAAAANRNNPQYSGAQGAAAGYATGQNQSALVYGAGGAAAGYAAGSQYAAPAAAANVSLPTDAGYGLPARGAGAAVYAGNHHTTPINGSMMAATGAAARNSYRGYDAFGHGWYGAHPGAWAPTGWTAGTAWGVTAWPAIGVSLGLAVGAQPLLYNYGTNVTYQDDQVYYGNDPVASADQYYQQASALAQSAPAPNPQAGDWQPLGVFALVQNDQADPHYVIQMAVNRSGTIGGNYADLISGTNVPIQGAVDKKAQRVAWTVGTNKNTVGETGLYNLTQDEAPALIHIGKDRTQQWLLVRLKQSADQNARQ